MEKEHSPSPHSKQAADHPMQCHAMKSGAPGRSQSPPPFQLSAGSDAPIQRTIEGYKPGTLRSNYIVMRGLNAGQMKTVQGLHDDTSRKYTRDEARQIATQSTTTGNKYAWEVDPMAAFLTPDAGVQGVLDNFGKPTTDTVRTYSDLAARVGYDAGSSGKGILSQSTVQDLHQCFDASMPLHMNFNPFLNSAWSGNLDSYGGSKTKIPLYSLMRSKLTQDFEAEEYMQISLNDICREVSNRPMEVHHILYKALYPDFAADTQNLMLTQRSQREKEFGPGQHELMHMISSGNDSNKFKKELPQVVETYNNWMKGKGGQGFS